MEQNKSTIIDLLDAIRQMQIRFSSYYTQAINKHNFAMQHFMVMFHLTYDQVLSMNEIAKRLGVSGPAVTAIVDHLEHEHLIERTPSKEDRRVTLVSITEKGRACVDQIQSRVFGILADTCSAFEEQALNHIIKFYKTLAVNFDKVISYENA